jgi:ribokinase
LEEFEVSMVDIGVIGSINMDLVVKAPRFPKPGETISGGELQMVSGGKGANQAVAAARMGASVAMFGRVGDDVFGPRLIKDLEDDGIDVRTVKTLEGVATGVALIVIDRSGQNTIVSSYGANESITPDELGTLFSGWSEVGEIVLQMELPLDIVEQAIRRAKSEGKHIILNAAPADARARTWFGDVDVLIVNETEAELLSGLEVKGVESARLAGRALRKAGAQVVILTLGERGALLFEGKQEQHVPAISVEVVDTTGAGDAFVGAYAAMRSAGEAHLAAVRYGVCAGALAVSVMGAQPSLPRKEDVEKLFAQVFGG